MVPACFLYTHLRVRLLRFLPGLPLPAHTVGANPSQPPLSILNQIHSYPPPFALADSPPNPHHPKQAPHTLTPQCKLFIQLTPAQSSLPPLSGFVHSELTPAFLALGTDHPPGEILELQAHPGTKFCWRICCCSPYWSVLARFDRGSRGEHRSVIIGGGQATRREAQERPRRTSECVSQLV